MAQTFLMHMVAQLGLVAGVLSTFVMGPGLAVAILLHFKKRRRDQRRSPISIDLLRSPGHSVREQLESASTDVTFDVLALCVLPLVVLALFLAQSHVQGLTAMSHLIPFYVGCVLLSIAGFTWKLVRKGERLDQLRAGFDAELAVGQELDQLMRRGAVVYHDFPAEAFNIDHVVISQAGVFAVETKGYTKPGHLKGREGAKVEFNGDFLRFPTWSTKHPLEQADRQAQWLGKWLSSATGDPIGVTPVLALPGWYVERSGRGSVRVFSGKELSGLLESRGTRTLSAEGVARVAHQVEQRCRTVVPTLRRTGEE